MGWRCEWRVTCDQCSARGPRGKDQDSGAAEKRAVGAGWIAWEGFYGRFHLCPECRKQPSEELGLKQSLDESNEVRKS